MKRSIRYKNGSSLSYADFGDQQGYPILIQHGLIASINDYQLFDRLIEAGMRLIGIARPGYGESSPYRMNNLAEWGDIVAALVAELGLSRFDILGISSGAPYSYAIGYRLPDKTRNIFILSGIPALYDDDILASWPYGVKKNASLAELEELAKDLFFSDLPPEALGQDDVKDSMMNNCFGIAQDLKLRVLDWGFCLPEITGKVYIQHSKTDTNVPFVTAEMTAKLLPNCRLEVKESGEHFSSEILDDFIKVVMLEHSGNKPD
jgi:pimeloyl-ACP methyl ester carboxylesterase